MRTLVTICFLIGVVTLSSGQKIRKHKKQKIEWECDPWWPYELGEFYMQDSIRMEYESWDKFSPADYLYGDFDGDSKIDYALAIYERKTEKKGVLIYHTGTKKYFILGAGKLFNERHPNDDLFWVDKWEVMEDKEKGINAILIVTTDSSRGLIYWSGDEYMWRQLED
jgi:hypothetical protein